MWHDIFHLGVPGIERVARAVLVYAFVVVAFRLGGKRELGQWNTLDLAVLLLVANAVQNGIIGADNSVTGAVIGAAVLIGLNRVVQYGAFLLPWLGRTIEGSPTTLIENGRLMRSALRRELISLPELRAVARRQGFADLSAVHTAILETNGTISMFKVDESPLYHPDESGMRIGKRRRRPGR